MMATSTPTQPPSSSTTTPQSPTPQVRDGLIRNLAWGTLIVCPIIMFLPPRKLDFYTLALLGGTFTSSNYLVYENSGRSIITRWGERLKGMSPDELPPKALEYQEKMRARKELELQKQRTIEGAKYANNTGREEGVGGVLAELEKKKQEEEEKARGLLKRVWMGGEGEDWKVERDQREKEALDEGRGYGGLISDQIWEVWNWGGKKAKGLKEKDEEVLEQRGEEGKKS